MKTKLIYLITVLMLILGKTTLKAQKENNWGIRFSGYVKNDVFYDSRQTVAAREGHFLLWPADERLDANNKDINAQATFNMLAVQSRLSGTIQGPDAFGAKTSGKIEGDFFAQANDNINLFRLRHAYVKFAWDKTNLHFGQYWNPFFVTSCFPATVSFNTGTPFQPFARNPQIRLTQSLGNIQLIAAALAQRDYTSRAAGGASSEYLRNSGMPDMHLQVHYKQPNFASGAGFAFKKIVPRLETDSAIKTSEGVSGLSAIAFTKLTLEPVTIKVEGVFGQNIPDVLQTSGFAVTSIDAATDKRTYSPINNMSLWTEIHTNGDKFRFGVFGGYSENIGTNNEIAPLNKIYGLGTNIKSLLRVSPRIVFNSGKARFALETEYTSAQFGDSRDNYAIPTNTTEVSNIRVIFSAYYFF